MAASPVGGPPANRPAPQVLHRVRSGLCVLTAVLTEIVLLAAVGNQAASKAIADHNPNPHTFAGYVLQSLLTFSWRFSPVSGDTLRLWPAQLARLGTILLLTGLLVWAIARGLGSFFRVFFGSWMAALVATQLAQVVFGSVLKLPPGRSQVVAAFFGGDGTGPSGLTFFAGLMLGFLVGLLTATIAMATRRRAGILLPGPPGVDEADTWLWGDEEYRAAAARSVAEQWPPREWSDPTVAMPGRYGGPPPGQPPQQPPGPQRQPGPPQPVPPAGWGGPPPSSARPPERAEERTQAYDFRHDPEVTQDVAGGRDSRDQPTQEFGASSREAGKDHTRELPPVREE